MQSKEILKFFFEMGQLSRVKREGWRLLGMETPESIADHSLRAAQIGWVLAKLEGYKEWLWCIELAMGSASTHIFLTITSPGGLTTTASCSKKDLLLS